MASRGYASQKCCNLIDRKSFDFFAKHAGKIPSISPFYPWNHRFQECSLAIFDPIFGRPPSSAQISMKLWSEMNISKCWVRNVIRILPSENYCIPKCSCQNALLPVKLPWRFAIFGFYTQHSSSPGHGVPHIVVSRCSRVVFRRRSNLWFWFWYDLFPINWWFLPHSSYSEGDHCPLLLSGLPAAHTFHWVIPQRPAPYFTVHSVGCLQPTPSTEWFLKARTLFHRSLSEMQLVQDVKDVY